MKATDEQIAMLARVERSHGLVHRVPDDNPVADRLVGRCLGLTGTRVYQCGNCHVMFTIEPEGTCRQWRIRRPLAHQ